tara:strand:- start:3171 stop:3902 length:732 start_codon:yes stop_codon:yes gene_type:complete
MPAYNSASFIDRSIESVVQQDFPDWELIVADDCSSDNTVEIVEGWASRDFRIRLIRMPNNAGPGPARNAGVDLAAGRFIAFLDSDDIWLPSKLTKQLAFMSAEGVALSYTAYKKISASDTVGSQIFFDAPSTTYRALLDRCVIQNSSAMYDTAKVGKVHFPNLRRRQDHALYLKLLQKTPIAKGLNEPLMHYRIRPGSVSSNKFKNIKYQWYLYRVAGDLNVPQSIYQLFVWALYGTRKYLRF